MLWGTARWGGTAQNGETGHLEAGSPEKVLRKEGRKEKTILGLTDSYYSRHTVGLIYLYMSVCSSAENPAGALLVDRVLL